MMNFPNFDPSKMDPKLLMEMSQLIQQLSPEQMSHLQTLMHNMMAGYDVKQEMATFEQTLPPDFRTKMMSLMMQHGNINVSSATSSPFATPSVHDSAAKTLDIVPTTESIESMDLTEARLTILRAVAQGTLSPEEAEKLLFKS